MAYPLEREKKTLHHLLFFILIVLVCSSCHKEIPQTKYFPNGNVEEQCHVRNGLLSGSYKVFYEDGMLRGEGQFRKGLPVGIWNNYYPNGEIMTIENHNRKGKLISFDGWNQDGIQVIKDGTGTIIQYYPDGSIQSVASYKNCLFDKSNEYWYPNGIKAHEFYYQEGKPVGTWYYWNEDGTLYKTEEYH